MNAYLLAAIPPALLLIARPQLWPWALAILAFVALAALGAAAHHFRNERDEARAERDRLERELEAATRPRLRLVPRQREPEHDSLPTNTDDAIWLNLYDENGRHQ